MKTPTIIRFMAVSQCLWQPVWLFKLLFIGLFNDLLIYHHLSWSWIILYESLFALVGVSICLFVCLFICLLSCLLNKHWVIFLFRSPSTGHFKSVSNLAMGVWHYLNGESAWASVLLLVFSWDLLQIFPQNFRNHKTLLRDSNEYVAPI